MEFEEFETKLQSAIEKAEEIAIENLLINHNLEIHDINRLLVV